MLKLLPTDILSGCEVPCEDDAIWCRFCSDRTCRVAVVTSAAGARRRTPLCPEHFLESGIALPTLLQLEETRESTAC